MHAGSSKPLDVHGASPKAVKPKVQAKLDDGQLALLAAKHKEFTYGWNYELGRAYRKQASRPNAKEELANEPCMPAETANADDPVEATWPDGSVHAISQMTNGRLRLCMGTKPKDMSGLHNEETVLYRTVHAETGNSLACRQRRDTKLLITCWHQTKSLMQVPVHYFGEVPKHDEQGRPVAMANDSEPVQAACNWLKQYVDMFASGKHELQDILDQKKKAQKELEIAGRKRSNEPDASAPEPAHKAPRKGKSPTRKGGMGFQ